MTSIAATQAAEYAGAVRDALRDLPPDLLHATVDGLDEHLAEIAADGTTDLTQTLGPPDVYAAELRAAAGLPTPPRASTTDSVTVSAAGSATDPAVVPVDGAAEPDRAAPDPIAPGDPVAPIAPAVASAPRHDRWVLAARVAFAAVLALVAIVVIRVSQPVNGLQVAFGAAAVGAAWFVMRWIGTHTRLPDAWASRLPLVLAAFATMSAVLLGGHLAGSDHQVVYVGGDVATTTYPVLYPGQRIMPDVAGLSVLDAEQQLTSMGFAVFVDGNPAVDDVAGRIVQWTEPVAGAVTPLNRVVLGISDRGVSTSPAPTSAPATIAPTTIAPTTTVATTIAATTVATTAVPTTTVPAP